MIEDRHEFCAWLKTEDKSEMTIQGYAQAVQSFARWFAGTNGETSQPRTDDAPRPAGVPSVLDADPQAQSQHHQCASGRDPDICPNRDCQREDPKKPSIVQYQDSEGV